MVLGPFARREPVHVNFAVRFQSRINRRLVIPLALFQGVTGLLIVWRTQIDILSTPWLLLAIVLYIAALTIAFAILIPTANELIEATSNPPPPPVEGAPPPSGPPPHIAALANRARLFSMINATLILVIVFLMVTKPF
jgi:hypothetical protein